MNDYPQIARDAYPSQAERLARISHQAALNTGKALVFEVKLGWSKISVLFKHAYHGSGWSSFA
jgi:hypothetical protein